MKAAEPAVKVPFLVKGSISDLNTGIVRTVDESTLVPDENLTIDEGAVATWQTLMWSLICYIITLITGEISF